MRLARVRINRTEHLAIVLNVGAWEIPVLQYEFTPEKVEVLGYCKDKRAYPEAQTEFTRLELRYGVDTDDGKTKAALSYGQGVMGVNSLRSLIEAEQKAEAEEGDSLELLNPVLNVVLNPDQETVDAARAAVLQRPDGSAPDQNAALLAQVLDQNKQLLALLAERNAPAPAAVAAPAAERPVLGLPKAQTA